MAEATPFKSRASSKPIFDRPPSCFDSLKRYVQETDVNHLDLSHSKLKIKEVATILEYVADSQVSELNLSCNNLKNEIEVLSELLIKTKVKKLNVSSCLLSKKDILSLMKILKETHVTDLDISKNDCGFYRGTPEFISYVSQSRLTALNIGECMYVSREEAMLFIQELCNTSLTHLNLDSVFSTLTNQDTLLSLFTNLKHTLITHLNLSGNFVGNCNLNKLGDSLRNSKLVELILSRNDLHDNAVNTLFKAIVGSKISTLNLAFNCFKGKNLCLPLAATQITCLDLSGNFIVNDPLVTHLLIKSQVVSLKLDHCMLSDRVIEALLKNLRSSKLTQLDLSSSYVEYKCLDQISKRAVTLVRISNDYESSGNQKFIAFGKCIAECKLEHLRISGGFICPKILPHSIAVVLDQIKETSVTLLDLSRHGLYKAGAERISDHLRNTRFTHFDLSANSIKDGVISLARNLKFTAITHLNLARNNIDDNGAEVLANHLRETCVNDLNLNVNDITSVGAIALAHSLRDAKIVCILRLNENKIKDDGMKALAEYAAAVLVTVIEVARNQGDGSDVETIIWNNCRQVQHFISFFKQIVLATDGNVSCFEGLVGNGTVDTFLEECLYVYKIVVEQPSVFVFLMQENNIKLSGDEINALLFEKFPAQFAWFVATQIEADINDHIHLLRKAEEWQLDKIVEILLLNRPIYATDESLTILHPYVYKLLDRYKLPICNLDVEPRAIEKIADYFSAPTDLEDAADVIILLENIKQSQLSSNHL